ncbi:hypothetical protein LLC_26210 (plasmid) [Lactococcus cremoris]|uniref:Uncharacterized protein n=1 Tax=Lactococcus lactis subsp. cremoris TaxID=1359 RepID=A0AAD1K108_LACLC|nr:hypothetical protein LLC_26210 [Lactococcus cremoris]
MYERNEKRIRFKVTFVFLKIQVVNRNQRYILENKKKKKNIMGVFTKHINEKSRT